jgi:hypothetical protein
LKKKLSVKLFQFAVENKLSPAAEHSLVPLVRMEAEEMCLCHGDDEWLSALKI